MASIPLVSRVHLDLTELTTGSTPRHRLRHQVDTLQNQPTWRPWILHPSGDKEVEMRLRDVSNATAQKCGLVAEISIKIPVRKKKSNITYYSSLNMQESSGQK